MNNTNIFRITILAIFFMLLIVGCRKKEDTIAIITVKTDTHEAVDNAQVVLYGMGSLPGSSVTVFDTLFTNSYGEAIFNYNDEYQLGQAGVAVLNIDVRKGLKEGEGIIKIDQETTTRETVFIN
jgi:hypothetical protein